MTRFRICCLALISCFAISLCAEAQTRRALIVAINNYEPPKGAKVPKGGRQIPPNLKGPVNDVEALRQVLIHRFEFEEKNIHTLLDRAATRDAMLAAIRKYIIEEPQRGDIVLFFYAGHGAQVTNSRTDEDDGFDETLVPADSYKGVWDIRDKELARLFNQALDKGVVLTAIFDSCHSGSNTRGLPRKARPRFAGLDPRDAAVQEAKLPPVGEPPERRGGLFLAAAQDNEPAEEIEDEKKQSHGVFTTALLDVLRNGPANLSAREVFLQVRARLAGEGYPQVPVLSGDEPRRKAPLFGGAVSGRVTAAVRGVDEKGVVELFGGYAVGIGKNTELRRVTANKDSPPLRLRVTREEGLNFSYAEVMEGKPADIREGMLFEVERWAPPAGASLRVYVPQSNLSLASLREFAARLDALQKSERVQWVEDPSAVSPTHVLTLAGAAWQLTTVGGGSVSLGANPTADAILKALPPDAQPRPRFFVYLPATAEIVQGLALGEGARNSAILLTASPDSAHYALVGRVQWFGNSFGIEYAWVRPGVSKDAPPASAAKSAKPDDEQFREAAQATEIPLPPRTDWKLAADSSDGAEKAASELELLVQNLAKLRAWLTLESPPLDDSEAAWPWQMAFRRVRDGAIVDAGTIMDGEQYSLILRVNPGELPPIIKQRYVYLFSFDAYGCGGVLYPSSKSSVENKLPNLTDTGWPEQFEVTHPGKKHVFAVSCNESRGEVCGAETYILLTSETPIPDTAVLELDCVRTRAAKGDRPGATELERLLSRVGRSTRGDRPATPKTWSIQRLVLRSVPRTAAGSP